MLLRLWWCIVISDNHINGCVGTSASTRECDSKVGEVTSAQEVVLSEGHSAWEVEDSGVENLAVLLSVEALVLQELKVPLSARDWG
jgi:hypothetical protein